MESMPSVVEAQTLKALDCQGSPGLVSLSEAFISNSQPSLDWNSSCPLHLRAPWVLRFLLPMCRPPLVGQEAR